MSSLCRSRFNLVTLLEKQIMLTGLFFNQLLRVQNPLKHKQNTHFHNEEITFSEALCVIRFIFGIITVIMHSCNVMVHLG